MNTARTRARERIRRLREMTTARGCTEAEAMAAAEKAAALMREHEISEADAIMDEAQSPSRQAGKGQLTRLWPVIAECTNTAVVVINHWEGAQVAFIGKEPGPEIAVYLREICERAVDRALADFKATLAYRRKRKLAMKRQLAAAFVGGMVYRLNQRLRQIFGPSIDRKAIAVASAALAERYADTTTLGMPTRERRHVDAALTGMAAGDKVTLAHGVAGGNAPLAIGSRS